MTNRSIAIRPTSCLRKLAVVDAMAQGNEDVSRECILMMDNDFKPGMRVVSHDGVKATFLRRFDARHGIFRYDDDTVVERVSPMAVFAPISDLP